MLPKEKIKPTSFNPRKLIIYSKPKVGKTTFASQLENNLILDFENGTDYVEALKINVNSITALENIIEEIKKAGNPYKYITLDTISSLEAMCEWTATRNYMLTSVGARFNRVIGKASRTPGDNFLPFNKWESVLTLPHGTGYYYLRKEILRIIDLVASVCDSLIILAHVKNTFVDSDTTKVDVKELDLTGKLKKIVTLNADATGYMHISNKGERKITFISSELDDAGSRCPHLANKVIDPDWNLIFDDAKT